MKTDLTLPDDPLGRFAALFDALFATKGWTDGVTCLRHAALVVTTTDGDPTSLAADVRRVSDVLKKRAGWFGPLNSSVRFLVAAMLVLDGISPQAFDDEVERAEALFKESGLPRGTIFTHLSALILLRQSDTGRVEGGSVQRTREIYDVMRKHHKFLTGREDLPASALLAGSDESAHRIGERVEHFYEGLVERGYSKGNALQTASHILFFNPRPDGESLVAFDELYGTFKDRGLRMNQGDYDEVAILSFLHHSAGAVVDRVFEHRRRIERLRPKPQKQASYSLACGTAFLDLVRDDVGSRDATTLQTIAVVQAVIQAQQAAMVAAASAASASAAGAG